MKTGPLSKLEKKNTMVLKTFDDDGMPVNYYVIVDFPIDG